jgi:hypothetical protein
MDRYPWHGRLAHVPQYSAAVGGIPADLAGAYPLIDRNEERFALAGSMIDVREYPHHGRDAHATNCRQAIKYGRGTILNQKPRSECA